MWLCSIYIYQLMSGLHILILVCILFSYLVRTYWALTIFDFFCQSIVKPFLLTNAVLICRAVCLSVHRELRCVPGAPPSALIGHGKSGGWPDMHKRHALCCSQYTRGGQLGTNGGPLTRLPLSIHHACLMLGWAQNRAGRYMYPHLGFSFFHLLTEALCTPHLGAWLHSITSDKHSGALINA